MSGLTEKQMDTFNRQGYLVVDDVEGLADCMHDLEEEYSCVLDALLSDLIEKGQIVAKYPHNGFSDRFTELVKETGRAFDAHFDFSLPQKGVTLDTPMWHGPAMFNVITHDPLLDIVESIIGGEIYSNPVQHVRIKPPEKDMPVNPANGRSEWGPLVSRTPWHQDSGVINESADDSNILTVWMPVWDVPVESGCLQVKPNTVNFGLYQHCPNILGASIPEKVINTVDSVSVAMTRGSVLLMHKLTPHSSLPNLSEKVRWSLDLRYNPIGQATGRDAFPGFVARSRKDSRTVLEDATIWAEMWKDTRLRLAEEEDPQYNRWDGDDPLCA